MAIRLSGLNSGLDTDAIVQELVSAYSLKTEKYEKQQTKLTWKQDSWKSLNTKIYSLYTNVSNLRYTSAYNLRKTTVSDNTKATVTASSEAVNGTQTLNILQTAQASYVTGAKLGEDVTSSTKMSELGYSGGNTAFTVEGKDGKTHEIEITKTTTVNDVIAQLKEAGLNASFDNVNKRIFASAKESGAANDFNFYAADEDGQNALTMLGLNIAMTKTDANGKVTGFTEAGAAKYQDAYNLYKKAQDVGVSVNDYIELQLEKYEDNKTIISDYKKQEKQYEARTAHNAIYAALRGMTSQTVTDPDTGVEVSVGILSSQLRDMVNAIYDDGEISEEEIRTYIDENGITLPDGKSAADVYNVLKDQTENMAIVESYMDDYNDLISLTPAKLEEKLAEGKVAYEAAVQENAENKYAYLLTENKTEEELVAAINNLAIEAEAANEIYNDPASAKGGAFKITGEDAIIELNGVTFTNATNSFSINGLTINAQAVTTDGPIQITTNVDTQGIYDKIKDFLTEYNSVINEMAKLYNAESAKDFEPLTDEEKEAMSEEQIEKWEDKIKGALLRRDGTLGSIMNAMVSSMQQSFEIDGKKLSLGSFGIETLGFLNAAENEHYAYHIAGDEDDENTSGKEDKLMKAIEENPEQLMQFMQKLTENLYKSIDEKMKSTELSSAYKVYNDKEMDKEATRIEEMIKKWEEKVSDQEEYYYDKFSQMEVALSKLQSQTSSISGLLGQ